jgi:hypothetical protein
MAFRAAHRRLATPVHLAREVVQSTDENVSGSLRFRV